MNKQPEPESLKPGAELPDATETLAPPRLDRNGKPLPRTAFRPGSNRYDGTITRRGKDQIPRGSARLMYAVVLADEREAIYRSLCKLAQTPAGALALLERIADRTEGKPTQRIEAQVSRTTVFGPDDRGVEPQPIGEGAAAAIEDPVARVVDEAIASRATVTTMLGGLDVSEEGA